MEQKLLEMSEDLKRRARGGRTSPHWSYLQQHTGGKYSDQQLAEFALNTGIDALIYIKGVGKTYSKRIMNDAERILGFQQACKIREQISKRKEN